jgi:hypothetical protein
MRLQASIVVWTQILARAQETINQFLATWGGILLELLTRKKLTFGQQAQES